jgi:protease-4
VVERLRRAREDKSIRAVILRVDSPGGSALASDLIWQEVARVRQQKPVLVSMSGYAASGGYYVSCGADSIFAEPGTLTGSIGVFAGKVDLRGFYEKIGVRREFVTRGANALLFGDNDVFNDEQRAALEAQLGDFYDRFVAKVAAGRHLETSAVEALAEGRVWTGQQAVENGLVDGLGGLQRAILAAKRMLGIPPGALVSVQTYEEPLTFIERLLASSLRRRSGGARVSLPALTAAEALRRDGTIAAAALLDGRPLALLPLRIQFH